jgi:predicted CXXCH cytochrome family protein
MKKILLVGAFAMIASTMFGQLSGSSHDFSGSGWTTEICLPCHIPHNGDLSVTDAPLWNHEVSTTSFTPYPTGGSMNATTGQPTGVSLLCLSCHDGVTAMDAFSGAPGGTVMGATVAGNFGSDLSNDHPISFTYDAALSTADGELFDPTVALSGLGSTIQNDMLFGAGGDQLECASCHDVHNNGASGVSNFLLLDNDGSALCLTCHNK